MTAIPIDPQIVGFHLSSLYSPIGWMSWADIARQWEAAQGDVTKLQQFKNTVLAETWTLPGQAVDWQRIYRLRRGYARGTVPVAAVVLTAGVDVQEDRLEVDVWAWGPRQQRWVVV